MHTQIAKNCIRFSVVKYDGQTWMIETKHSIKGTVLLVGPNEKGRQIFNDKEVEVLYTPAQLAVYFINNPPLADELSNLSADFIGDDFSDDMPTLLNNSCTYSIEPGTIAGTFTLTIYGDFQTGESEASYLYFSQEAIKHDIELAAKSYQIKFTPHAENSEFINASLQSDWDVKEFDCKYSYSDFIEKVEDVDNSFELRIYESGDSNMRWDYNYTTEEDAQYDWSLFEQKMKLLHEIKEEAQ